jgi:hypothetical protein
MAGWDEPEGRKLQNELVQVLQIESLICSSMARMGAVLSGQSCKLDFSVRGSADAAGSARNSPIDVGVLVLVEKHRGVNGRHSDNTLIQRYLYWESDATLRKGLQENPRVGSRSISRSTAAVKLASCAKPKCRINRKKRKIENLRLTHFVQR